MKKKLKNYPNLEPMRKLVAGLAPDIAAAVQQGASRASQVEKYKACGLTDYWVCAALHVMGMDIPHDNSRKNIVRSMSKYRRAQAAKRRYEANKTGNGSSWRNGSASSGEFWLRLDRA